MCRSAVVEVLLLRLTFWNTRAWQESTHMLCCIAQTHADKMASPNAERDHSRDRHIGGQITKACHAAPHSRSGAFMQRANHSHSAQRGSTGVGGGAHAVQSAVALATAEAMAVAVSVATCVAVRSPPPPQTATSSVLTATKRAILTHLSFICVGGGDAKTKRHGTQLNICTDTLPRHMTSADRPLENTVREQEKETVPRMLSGDALAVPVPKPLHRRQPCKISADRSQTAQPRGGCRSV